MTSSSSAPVNLWVLLGLSLAGIALMAKKFTKKAVKVDFGAFLKRFEILPPPQPLPPKAPHPLTGLSFAVSDLFDIDGFVTGFGNPEWEKTHEAASQHHCFVFFSTCRRRLPVLEKLWGCAIESLGYISGENRHYGTPTNPISPARIPGGSCSGAAVAVAAKLVDFALGISLLLSCASSLEFRGHLEDMAMSIISMSCFISLLFLSVSLLLYLP
ncbi:outer envelope protein 64, chloroplastic [Tanacetum coccineum]